MAKRDLNRRQAWRVKKIQEERLERAQRRAERVAEEVGNELGPEQEGLLLANYGATLEVEGEDGQIYRCAARSNLDIPVVGDRVVWQAGRDNSGIIVAIAPRHSELQRPDLYGKLKPLAANVDQILVVVAPSPAYETYLIDQYLVAAETTGIAPIIIFNKADLISDAQRAADFRELDSRYRRLGYRVMTASTVSNDGLDALQQVLTEKISVFVGQSGVGKSSLINTLLPGTDAATRQVSEATGFGRHTTSTSRLYHLPCGGSLIDSPGIRDFRLWYMEPEGLIRGFVEFQPFLGQCRFRDCRHLDEPGCALREAVAHGDVDPARLDNFHRMVSAVEAHRPSY